MNILFLGYWGFNEGLTQATILPHLKILSGFKNVENIYFCSIERTEDTDFDIDIPKVQHIPLYSVKSKIPLLDKIQDFTLFPKQIIELCNTYAVDKIICRGAPAGALGYLIWKKTKLPYYVESYEPHAQYMLESNVWKKWDPRYLLQKRWESKQNKTASALMPVAENYKDELIKKGVNPIKIDTIPCCVDLDKFGRNNIERDIKRAALGFNTNHIVFIYVGKFGGLYVDEEACLIFSEILEKIPDSRFIILTTSDKKDLKNNLKKNSIDTAYFQITSCNHKDVPNFLSASDFALALYKQGESKKYLSPIKVGEYWANGLPVIIPDGIGDDTEIIKNEGGGIVLKDYSKKSILEGLSNINLLQNEQQKCTELSKKYRGFKIVKSVYTKWYSN